MNIRTINPNFRNSEGFTLIELLVAIFILTIGIIAILQAFPLGTYVQKSAQMTSTAIQLSQAKMEEIISQSYNEISLGIVEEDYGSITNFNSYKRRTEVSYFDPNNPEVPPSEDLGIKKIEVTVFWRSPLGISEKEVKIANLIAQR